MEICIVQPHSAVAGNAVADSSGNLYGAAQGGLGVVFKFATSGKFSVLYSFTENDGVSQPIGGLVIDQAGNLYGSTYRGGAGCGSVGCGAVFKIAE
jgi:uncharacterized repeat protein (TIGR03803 family)